MKEAYSTQELLELAVPGLPTSRENISRKAAREKWQFLPRPKTEGNGKLWLVSSMPQETQIAIRIATQKQALTLYAPAPIDTIIAANDTTNAIFDDKRRYVAMAKADLVRLYLEWQKKHGDSTAQKDSFINAYEGRAWPKLWDVLGSRSWKTLERWKLKQAKTGDVLALADRRGIARKGMSALTDLHHKIILGSILNPNAPALSSCIRRIQGRCQAEGIWEPSDQTIRRFVERYQSECFDEWIYFREGKKAWNDKCAISILRDWSLVDVGDVVIADGHVLNFETINPETGKPKRMTLLLFYDGASNHPLGWEIMPSENVACISAAFRRTCILLGKFPRVVYLDNGKAFRAKFFKGVDDFQEEGFLGLYKALGCTVIHAWPYHGQSKTIERFFGTLHDLEVFIPSYTGRDIASKPARMKRGEDLHRRLYEKMDGRPLTLEETHRVIANWFVQYTNRVQPKTPHLAGRTPAEVFDAGRGPGVDLDRLNLLMLQKEIRTLTKDGFTHRGRSFWHEAISTRRHPVLIRYDDVLSPYTVLVYTLDGEFICEARDRNHFGIAAGMHPAAHALGTPAQIEDLSKAIALKKERERTATANLRGLLDDVVLPEMRKAQEQIQQKADVIALPKPAEPKPMTAEEIAEIEEKAARALKKLEEAPTYQPSNTMRFRDELARYQYLFTALHENRCTLTAEDAAWMARFEETPSYQRNFKRRFDALLEYYTVPAAQA